MAMPNAATLAAMVRAFDSTGLRIPLGTTLLDQESWHQSLSNRFKDSAEELERLLEVGRNVTAAPFTLTLNRLRGDGKGPGMFLLAFQCFGTPKGFTALLRSIRSALQKKEMPPGVNNTPHVTISYWAQTRYPTIRIQPIDWIINELLLVRGGGAPYRYEVVGRWPLVGEPPSP